MMDGEAFNIRARGRMHIEEMWGAGREDLASTLYADDVRDHNPAPDQRPGLAGILDVLRWLREAVPDLSMRVDQYVVDPPYIADRWTMTGTHTGAPLMGVPASGRAFRISGMDVSKFGVDGKITDIWHVEEFWRLRDQLTEEPASP
ncbi:MAG: ester cyclase [Pseudomonadota bacterium]